MGYVVGVIFSVMLLSLIKTSTVFAFNRSHVGVVFEPSPFIKDRTAAKLVAELVHPLSKISSEFNKISIRLTDYEMTTIAVGLIPAAVATYNRDYLKSNESPLELSVLIMKGDSRGESLNRTAFALEITTIAADDANKIYPGTVKQIFIEHSDFMEETEDRKVREFEAYLANAPLDFQKAQFKYELGASIPLYYCADDGLPQVLRHIRHISFSWWPNLKTEWAAQDPKLAAERLSREFEECQRIIREYGKDITIQVETGWLCSNNETDHDRNLVAYWEAINNWAVKANASILFSDAFDKVNGTHENIWELDGWWKLVKNQNDNGNSTEHYIFVEKRSILEEGSNSPKDELWGWRLAVFLICVVLSIVFTFIFKRGDTYGEEQRCW